MKQFNNKVVVITGAASGMGREYALEFARLGALVAITDVNEKALAETHAMVQKITDKYTCCEAMNIASQEDVMAFSEKVKAKLGNAHVIINNAGIGGGGAGSRHGPISPDDEYQFLRGSECNQSIFATATDESGRRSSKRIQRIWLNRNPWHK
jgi:NAD(P)-dependent dehydrogenase (short-subunit alcohol dehydrogenase family)